MEKPIKISRLDFVWDEQGIQENTGKITLSYRICNSPLYTQSEA